MKKKMLISTHFPILLYIKKYNIVQPMAAVYTYTTIKLKKTFNFFPNFPIFLVTFSIFLAVKKLIQNSTNIKKK